MWGLPFRVKLPHQSLVWGLGTRYISTQELRCSNYSALMKGVYFNLCAAAYNPTFELQPLKLTHFINSNYGNQN